MRKKLFVLLSLFYAAGAIAEDVTTYTPAADEGIVYFLPKTAVEVDFVVTQTDYKPGEFSKYANRYLRINNVATQPSQAWNLKEIKIRPIGVVDSTKAYVIKLSQKSLISNVELTDEGIIKAINTDYTGEKANEECILQQPLKHENGRKYMTEEILLAGSTAKMAELTAKEIYNIRESKNLILRGQVDAMPKDGASLELVINNLDKQEKALYEMFIGTTDIQDKVFRRVVVPQGNIEEQIMFRISENLGVVDLDDLAGEPIYISIEDMQTVKKAIPSDDKKKKKQRLGGAIYNIPGKGNVRISFKGKDLINQDFFFAQFGNTETLAYELFNKKTNTKVVFNPSTGGINKIDSQDKE